jgi:hypothetical protein
MISASAPLICVVPNMSVPAWYTSRKGNTRAAE